MSTLLSKGKGVFLPNEKGDSQIDHMPHLEDEDYWWQNQSATPDD